MKPVIYTSSTITNKLGISLGRLTTWLALGFITPTFPTDGQGKKTFYTFSDLCKVYLFSHLLTVGLKRSLAARIIAEINTIHDYSVSYMFTHRGITIEVPLKYISLKIHKLLKRS